MGWNYRWYPLPMPKGTGLTDAAQPTLQFSIHLVGPAKPRKLLFSVLSCDLQAALIGLVERDYTDLPQA